MTKHKFQADDELYVRAIAIRDGQRRGLWLPKIRALARRGHVDAIIELADWLADCDDLSAAAANLSRAVRLYRRAYLKGAPRAAHNLAMTYFNRNNLAGYRTWMRNAVRAGDREAQVEAARFEIRLPHRSAAKIGRIRPFQRRDEVA